MVLIKVDLKKREELKRLHTVTHILNHSARQVLGNHIWQNGSNLKHGEGSLDLTHYEVPTREQLTEIENKVNEVIFENKKVKIEELERTQAEKKYGFSLYQGGAIPMKKLRIIHIIDSDIEACGGLHMESTGGIGIFKITDVQKIQDGVIRFKYKVRNYALQNINEDQTLLLKSSSILGVHKETLPLTVEKFFKEWKEQKKEILRLKDKLKDLEIKNIDKSKETDFTVEDEFEMGDLIEIYTKCMKNKNSLKIKNSKLIISPKNEEITTSYKKKIDKGEYIVYII